MYIIRNIKEFARNDKRVAAVGKEGKMTYRELEDRSEAMAAWFLENCPEKHPVIIWG